MLQKLQNRLRRKARVRSLISGTTERPRLSIFRTTTHIYAQIIDDTTGKTLASSSDLKIESKASKTELAIQV
jgi:large subunit ribosomal protein L18